MGICADTASSSRASRRSTWSRAALIGLALLASHPVVAVQPDEMLKDPVLEQRARSLSRELRCMVCQNQSIDDSEAPLARDLRILVRELLTAGDSDPQVMDFLVARYGEFVLLQPRFEWHTAMLWLTPIAVLVLGAIALVVALLRRRVAAPALPPLSPEEERALAKMVEHES
jgi:cytochrome c-type biogenesis protein CcmH